MHNKGGDGAMGGGLARPRQGQLPVNRRAHGGRAKLSVIRPTGTIGGGWTMVGDTSCPHLPTQGAQGNRGNSLIINRWAGQLEHKEATEYVHNWNVSEGQEQGS